MTSGFGQQGDDEVVARLSVDVPPESAAGLQSIARQARDLRTTMEAIAKSQGDYNRYVQQLPELLRRAEQAQERFTAQANQLDPRSPSSSSGGTGGSRVPTAAESASMVREMMSAPGFQQMVTTIAAAAGGVGVGAVAGMTTNVNQATGGAPGQPTANPGQVRSVAAAMEELRARDPRQYANLMAQHGAGPTPSGTPAPTPGSGSGGGPPADPRNERNTGPEAPVAPPDWLASGRQAEQQALGVLSKILSQTSSGGNMGVLTTAGILGQGAVGTGLNIQRQLQQRIEHHAAEAVRLDQARAQAYRDNLPLHEQDELERDAARAAARASQLNRVAGVGRGITRAGAVVGLAAGAGTATQEVGEWMQRHRNVGLVRGGGFQEGFAFEAGIRQMAMNPFLSTEQSRRIMMEALSKGYTGKEFDTITEFMAQNLRDLNIDTATSMRMVTQQRNIGGQSMESIEMDLRDIKRFIQENPENRRTLPEAIEGYQQRTETGIAAGFSGQTASRLAEMGTAIYADSGLMKNVPTALVDGGANSLAAQQLVSEHLPQTGGTPFDVVSDTLNRPGGEREFFEASGKAIEQLARNYAPELQSPDETTKRNAVKSFMNEINYAWPQMQLDENMARQMLDDALSEGGLSGKWLQQAESYEKSETGGPGANPGVGTKIGDAIQGGVSAVASGTASLLGALIPGGRIGDAIDRRANQWDEEAEERAALSRTPWMNPAVKDFITKQANAKEVMVKGKDGQEMSLMDAMNNQQEEILKGLPTGDTQVRMPGSEEWSNFTEAANQAQAGEAQKGSTLIDLTERAAEYLKVVQGDDPRTPSQQGADTGRDGYSRQEPKPGENPGGR